MATPFNPLSHIMKSAHWAAHYKRVSGDLRAYAVLFREQLKLAWGRWKTQQEAKRNWQVRQQLRDEQNAGLPLRSTPIDYRPTTYMRSSRFASIGQ